AGGSGGRVERISWDNEIIWGFNYSSDIYHQHHDIEVMPNGNILIIAWEKHTEAESLQAGRDPEKLSPAGLWAERIVEVQPLGNEDYEVIWEWHLWDHLIQEFDANLPNYGSVAEHPERIDLNYIGLTGVGGADWVHLNSIDYQPELDQILVSTRAFSEIWILDHSTTTQEAAGHSGGQSGKGGDLLYRWGNPQTYQQGTSEDQQLFTAHDAHWIESGLPDAGKILLYNNGIGRPEGVYSTVEILEPPMNTAGNYVYEPATAYGPATPDWIYTAEDPESFFSKILSGAQRLPNGNTLICEGMYGRIFEITPDEETVWEYVNPINQWGPVSQGDPAIQNHVFRAYRFAAEHPALVDKPLPPGVPLELNPWPVDCALSSSLDGPQRIDGPKVYPLPFEEFLYLDNPGCQARHIRIWNAMGSLVHQGTYNGCRLELYLSGFQPGIYGLQVDRQPLLKILKSP
ncbi:MAG: aryl-sulfate sulfotransferase, partial [Phaeodactylibacter sp.]|nr:aryl-sulfate sulfotransferase [Phaeodactylibacter sp.]